MGSVELTSVFDILAGAHRVGDEQDKPYALVDQSLE